LLLNSWSIYFAVSGLFSLGGFRYFVTIIISHQKEPFDGAGDLQYTSATFNGCQTSVTPVNAISRIHWRLLEKSDRRF
jgi:hypothetical protein